MSKYLNTSIGRLRIISVLEGCSLLVLLFIAVPLKHILNEPYLVAVVGPVHGALFVLFVINGLTVSIEQRWKFAQTTWKVLLACLIPFGTFIIDQKILRPIFREQTRPSE